MCKGCEYGKINEDCNGDIRNMCAQNYSQKTINAINESQRRKGITFLNLVTDLGDSGIPLDVVLRKPKKTLT